MRLLYVETVRGCLMLALSRGGNALPIDTAA